MSTTAETTRNGVDTGQLFGTLDAIKGEPSLATFQFRARNRWIDGAHNRSTIRDFYAANQEDESRTKEFVLDAGEPAILLGTDILSGFKRVSLDFRRRKVRFTMKPL